MERKHKVDWGPGWTYFECDECGQVWRESSRDCASPSSSVCECCDALTQPSRFEPHYEWKTDVWGNIDYNAPDAPFSADVLTPGSR